MWGSFEALPGPRFVGPFGNGIPFCDGIPFVVAFVLRWHSASLRTLVLGQR